ncbi:hypothetical protein WCD74_09460 [Actinomycetospora sp. OC33-EN08]|uniref:DUF4386 domain-containing protein n=1 Tax=Actinomycetospora aurantiaca TaxID=3129233 RepID=A0ABU8MMR8_9PSEU
MTITHRHLLTLGGAALAASGITGLAGGMLHPVVDGQSHSAASITSPGGPPAYLLLYGGAILLMLGLPAVTAWLAPRVGVLGVAGLTLYFVGNALSAQSHLVVEGFVARDLPQAIPDDGSIVASGSFALLQTVGGLVFVAGVLLTGLALVRRSSGIPWWVGGAFVLSALGVLIPLPEAPVLTGLQVELFEAVGTVALGVLAMRAARSPEKPATRRREPALDPA